MTLKISFTQACFITRGIRFLLNSTSGRNNPKDPMYLISNGVCGHQLYQCYKRRMQIEHGFRDIKSRFGFGQLVLKKPTRQRVAILWLLACLAYALLFLSYEKAATRWAKAFNGRQKRYFGDNRDHARHQRSLASGVSRVIFRKLVFFKRRHLPWHSLTFSDTHTFIYPHDYTRKKVGVSEFLRMLPETCSSLVGGNPDSRL